MLRISNMSKVISSSRKLVLAMRKTMERPTSYSKILILKLSLALLTLLWGLLGLERPPFCTWCSVCMTPIVERSSSMARMSKTWPLTHSENIFASSLRMEFCSTTLWFSTSSTVTLMRPLKKLEKCAESAASTTESWPWSTGTIRKLETWAVNFQAEKDREFWLREAYWKKKPKSSYLMRPLAIWMPIPKLRLLRNWMN